MKIIIRPNNKAQYQCLKDISAIEPPIWHCLLADKYDADLIIDAEVEGLNGAQLEARVKAYKPDKIYIMATGSHPSAFFQATEGAVRFTKIFNDSECITSLPVDLWHGVPRWDLIDVHKYRCHNWHGWTTKSGKKCSPYGVTYTSISCPFRCAYCAIHGFYGMRYELRDLKKVYSDFDYFATEGIENIKIMDELFTFNERRIGAICDYLNGSEFNIWAYARFDRVNEGMLKKMKRAGINWLAYGIDDFKGGMTNRKIRDIVKMTQDAGIAVMGNFIFGFWEDSMKKMLLRLDFAAKTLYEYVNFYCLTAYPGSKIRESYKEEDLPTKWEQYAQTSPEFKPLPTKYLKGSEVLKFRDEAFKRYFSNPDYQDMVNNKFGANAVSEVNDMLQLPFRRK